MHHDRVRFAGRTGWLDADAPAVLERPAGKLGDAGGVWAQDGPCRLCWD